MLVANPSSSSVLSLSVEDKSMVVGLSPSDPLGWNSVSLSSSALEPECIYSSLLLATTCGSLTVHCTSFVLVVFASLERFSFSSSDPESCTGEGDLTRPVLSYSSTSRNAFSFNLSYLHWKRRRIERSTTNSVTTAVIHAITTLQLWFINPNSNLCITQPISTSPSISVAPFTGGPHRSKKTRLPRH